MPLNTSNTARLIVWFACLVFLKGHWTAPAQEVLWVRDAGGNREDCAEDVAVDSAGNAYVTGWFEEEATFGRTNLICTGFRDAFLAKYDTAGNLLWVIQGTSGMGAAGYSVTVDVEDNLVASDIFSVDLRFGTNMVATSAVGGLFLVKCDPTGSVLWLRAAEGDIGSGGTGRNSSSGSRLRRQYLSGWRSRQRNWHARPGHTAMWHEYSPHRPQCRFRGQI